MKAKLLFSCLLLGFASVSIGQAQEVNTPGRKTAYMPTGFWDNWFIQLGAGAQTFISPDDTEAKFSTDAITLAPTFAIGKWFKPHLGVRIKGEGGALHSFLNDDQVFMEKNTYYGGHIDFMWNMTNYFCKYNPKRVFSFTPYWGVGYLYRKSSDQVIPTEARTTMVGTDEITWNAGLLFQFRLSDRVGIHVDLAGIMTDDYMNRIIQKKRYEGIVSATGGLTFNLGKVGFEPVIPMDYGLVNDLNNKINGLRNQVDELSKRPVSCPKCPEPQPVQTVEKVMGAPAVVLFRIGSDKVDANQHVGIYNTAQFMKSSGEKVKVIGYADKQTGTAAYNLKLSEQRAKAVAKELVSKYNIPSSSIIVEWKGASEQPYGENNWNRVVIMKAD